MKICQHFRCLKLAFLLIQMHEMFIELLFYNIEFNFQHLSAYVQILLG